MEFLTVYNSVYPKKRYGTNGDGGYVIATNIGTYDLLISCGVADDINFELEFLKNNTTPSLAFDGTINRLPDDPTKSIQFHKLNISPDNSDTTTNLHNEIKNYNDIFLKMDIETYEFRWLYSLNESHLNKFKQIVIEFHFPFYVHAHRGLDVQLPVSEKMNIFKVLANTHTLVHLHGNNCCGTTTYEGIVVPNVFECTYVRKDVQQSDSVNTTKLPCELDVKNVGGPDIDLNHIPFVHPGCL